MDKKTCADARSFHEKMCLANSHLPPFSFRQLGGAFHTRLTYTATCLAGCLDSNWYISTLVLDRLPRKVMAGVVAARSGFQGSMDPNGSQRMEGVMQG